MIRNQKRKETNRYNTFLLSCIVFCRLIIISVFVLEMEELKRFLYELILIDSHENEEFAVKFLRDVIGDLGDYDVELQNVIGKSFNLIVNPVEEPKFVVVTHIDTIPLKSEAKVLSESIIGGTGSVDAKGSVASIVFALSKMKSLPNYLSFAILSGEERDSSGCLRYLEKFSPKKALILEPSNLEMYFGSVGYVEFNVFIHGFARHPDFVAVLKNFEWDNPVEIFYKWLSEVKKECSKISCSVVPLHISTDGDLFTTPSKLEAKINLVIGEGSNVSSVLKALKSLNIDRVSFTVEDASNPFKTRDEAFIKIIEESYIKFFGKTPSNSLYPAWTDATLFYERGIPVAIFGPGDYSLAHTINEKISIDDVSRAGLFITKLAEDIEDEIK